jgi:serine/threonine protein kinase
VDSAGQPKIIDFGVARAADSDLVMPTLQTSVGDLVGTLQYMSPEQREADPCDIDTRSDVYSPGVILYELICGRLPYDVTRAPVHEAAAHYGNKTMPATLDVSEWLQGEMPVEGADPTIIVFWESWCPFSQKRVPAFDAASRPCRERGLKVITLAKATEQEGREHLVEFVREKAFTLPTARSGRDVWRYFDVAGTPGAAAIKDGRVVFAGSLSLVGPEILDALMM